jgi:hypothetical protein
MKKLAVDEILQMIDTTVENLSIPLPKGRKTEVYRRIILPENGV